MAILDQYGQPYRYTYKFAHAAERNAARGPQYLNVLDDLEVLIPQQDRMTLQSLSRRLYTNFGPCKAAVDQKASYSVGQSWRPVFGAEDVENAEAAKAFLEDRFYPLCEVRGPNYNWTRVLTLISKAIDRDGEAFVLLTEAKNGDPRIQLIPAHRIGQRDMSEDIVQTGPYGGLKIVDGVIQNAQSRAVAYRVLGDDPKGRDDKEISARSMIHAYCPDYQEQVRGLPAFTHALTDFLHCIQSTEYERIAQLMVSSLGLIEYNEMGGPEFDDPAVALQQGSTATNGVTMETFAGGAVRYFRANSGAKLESVKHDRPGDLWDRFQDRLIRSALAGIQWPMALVWKSTGQGTAERQEVVRARRAIEERQQVLRGVAQRICSYAVGSRIDAKQLKPFARFWDIDFTLPPRLTVDDGREAKAQLEQWEAGAINMTELLSHKGRTTEQHYRERAMEVAARKRIAREVADATGEDVSDADMCVTKSKPATENEDSNNQDDE